MNGNITEENMALVNIEIKRENQSYIVEDLQTGEFFEMNEVCINALKMIQNNVPYAEIENKLVETYPDEDIDLDGFIQQLSELELIRNSEQAIKKSEMKNGLLSRIPVCIGKAIINKVSVPIFCTLFFVNVVILLSVSFVQPKYSDFFIFEPMTFNLLTWLFLSLIIILIHESGHILAARSFGLPTSLGIGSRMLFVVFETDLTYIWRLNKKERNIIYLAGLFFDNTVLFLALLTQFLVPETSFVFLLCKLVTLQTLINIIYQFGVFMKTDLYYFLENATGCYNLQEMVMGYLRTIYKKTSNSTCSRGQRGVILIYGMVYLIGSFSILFVLLFLAVPQMYYAIVFSLEKLELPPSTFIFWDGAIFIGQTILMAILLIYSWSQKIKSFRSSGSFE